MLGVVKHAGNVINVSDTFLHKSASFLLVF